MLERLFPRIKTPLSECLGGISVAEKGATIGGRYFPEVIACFGGGTGLEAIIEAEKHPQAAIVTIDPLVGFGQEVLRQLTTSKKGIDWSFFTGNHSMRQGLEVVSSVYDQFPDIWKNLVRAYTQRREIARKVNDRLFWVEASTKAIEPEPVFDEVIFNFPKQTSLLDRSIYENLAKSVRPGGKIHVVTDSGLIYNCMRAMGDDQVKANGAIHRTGKVHKPISAYDLILKPEFDRKFVDIKAQEAIEVPSHLRLLLAAFAFNMLDLAQRLPPETVIVEK